MWDKIVSQNYIKPLLILVLCIGSHWANAQTTLPLETGRVVYYEIVELDSFPKDTLLRNARRWLANHSFTDITDSLTSESASLRAKGQFPVYATGYVSKRQNGIVTYTVQLESKNSKYRYRFTDFVFHYYHENRNYQLVATGKTKPLEEITASGWQKTWEYNRKMTHQTISNLIENLKKEMVYRVSTEKAAPTEEKKW